MLTGAPFNETNCHCSISATRSFELDALAGLPQFREAG
jgi:hypothetical protein